MSKPANDNGKPPRPPLPKLDESPEIDDSYLEGLRNQQEPDPKIQQQVRDLCGRLFRFLHTYVDKAIRPVLLEQLSSGSYRQEPFPPHDLLMLMSIVIEASEDEQRKKQETVFSETQQVLEYHIYNETVFLMAAWLCEIFGENGVIELSELDDAMLPPDEDRLFEECYTDKNVPNLSMAREILRQVRRDLPAGKILPDELAEFLSLMGTTII